MNKKPITEQIDQLFQPFIESVVNSCKDPNKYNSNMEIICDCIRDLEAISNCANQQLKTFKLLKEIVQETKEKSDIQK